MDNIKSKLVIIIPTFNEQETIRETIRELEPYCLKYSWSIIVVNDGSTDSTSQVLLEFAKENWIQVFSCKNNRGYGAAIKTGVFAAQGFDLMVTYDADGQHSPQHILSLVTSYERSHCDLIVGERCSSSSGLYRSIGKKIISLLTYMLFSHKIFDLNSGLKLYKSDILKSLVNTCPPGMAFSESIVLMFLSENRKVSNVSIDIRTRAGGTSKVNTRTAFVTVFELLNLAMFLKPLRVFLPASFVLIAVGAIWATPILVRGHGLSVGGLFLFITGISLIFWGLVAEQIRLLRMQLFKLDNYMRGERKDMN